MASSCSAQGWPFEGEPVEVLHSVMARGERWIVIHPWGRGLVRSQSGVTTPRIVRYFDETLAFGGRCPQDECDPFQRRSGECHMTDVDSGAATVGARGCPVADFATTGP